jgi:large subunit ribosomal protein L28
MAKKCAICGKTGQFGHNVSHAKNRTQRTWQPNLQKVKIMLEGKPQKVYVCTRCLRSAKVEKA